MKLGEYLVKIKILCRWDKDLIYDDATLKEMSSNMKELKTIWQ